MRWFQTTLATALFGLLIMGVVSDAAAAEGRRGGCRRGERLNIQNLDVSPDPIIEGQRLRS